MPPKHLTRHSLGTLLTGALLAATLSAPACIVESSDDQEPGRCSSEDVTCGGGGTTVFDFTDRAFGFAARNLDQTHQLDFEEGRFLFHAPWSPAEQNAQHGINELVGLGPLFHATSCGACHARDGRAAPYDGLGQPTEALLLRISVPNEAGEAAPVPGYGDQLQPRGVAGVRGEVSPSTRWSRITGSFADGTPYELVRPIFTLESQAYGALPQDVMISARITPQMYGLGLLEAIPASDILALADPDDADGDGISGRPNVHHDADGSRRIGRFGWKASHATLDDQNAAAFLGDMGITTPRRATQNCESEQMSCLEAPVSLPFGESVELPQRGFDQLTLYTRHLAVPARRDATRSRVERGQRHFEAARCDACHVPRWETSPAASTAALASQVIFPYTDLLLHDMGEGLADNRPDGVATGSEWRTPPLWGLGMLFTVNQHQRLLHDGRARNFSEAILWHGGEAAASREAYVNLSQHERDELILFLESL